MKKLFKIAVNFMAVALMAVATFGFAACEDIKKLELSLNLYNYTDNAFYAENDVKFSVDLYRHLAPKTVDAVLEHVKNGYYNGAIFYEQNGIIMVGDLKIDENGNVVQNLIGGKLPSEIYGEFESNGTTGSDLVNKKGSIGIWRSYYANDTDTYKTSSNARNSGRATWYIPTSEKSDYNGYFCIFAQYDTEDTANAKAIEAITAIFANADYYTEYVIYYTGEYNAEKPDENYGLEFHAVKKDDFDEDTEVFEAEGQQLVCFNKKTVKIPNVVGGTVSAEIKSVK
ncbi:MAG: peptidylprolyl isomerase [Clostridia bacterium]|nr:peptidylprolyl isomerase [Clostridia bacterium]